jgi:hypothetical protein
MWSGGAAQRVARLQTVAEGHGSGACRCIKFGEGPVDLLAFSEHSNFCHLVDSRAFYERQVRAPLASRYYSLHIVAEWSSMSA